jgi:hypothetical protein
MKIPNLTAHALIALAAVGLVACDNGAAQSQLDASQLSRQQFAVPLARGNTSASLKWVKGTFSSANSGILTKHCPANYPFVLAGGFSNNLSIAIYGAYPTAKFDGWAVNQAGGGLNSELTIWALCTNST